MGASRGLWDMLKPVARHESLDSLHGKPLAVDLSFWVIQLLSRVRGIPLRKPHIRLLFFRAIHLVARIGAFPVFVADGEPPPLKLEVRIRRFSRISGVPFNNFVGDLYSSTSQSRNRLFTESIEDCVKLAELLGFPVLRAKHEAEGLCAELQRQGLVNACLTPDSDVFLYGAEYVIKILQADLKDPHVESYSIRDIESMLGLYREHLVALALLSGCNYNICGVPEIGYQNAVRLVKAVPKEEVLQRLHDWGAGRFVRNDLPSDVTREASGLKMTENSFSKEPLGSSSTPPHCSSCGHPGTKTLHTKIGCERCQLDASAPIHQNTQGCSPKVRGFKCTCDYCSQKELLRKHSKQEGWMLNVCQKISSSGDFPNKDIIQMFMNPEHDTFSGDRMPPLIWKPPCVEALEKFLEEHLNWNKTYVRQKLLPLLSFYCLKDTAAMRRSSAPCLTVPSIQGIYVPHSIQRIKILFSKPLYRLRWTRSPTARSSVDWLGLFMPQSNDHNKTDDFVDFEWSVIQIENFNNYLVFTTDEDMILVNEAYPALVAQFEHERALRKAKKNGTFKKKNTPDSSGKQLQITSFFHARKGASGDDASRSSQCEALGSMLFGKKNIELMQGLCLHKNVDPKLEVEAYSSADANSPRTCKLEEMTEIGIIHADDILKDRFAGDQHCSQISHGTSDTKANNLRITAQNTYNQSLERPVKVEELELPSNVWAEDFDRDQRYPCKANRLDNDSPGSQKNRERFQSCSNPGFPDTILDRTPPFSAQTDSCIADKAISSELLKVESSKVTARRALFS